MAGFIPPLVDGLGGAVLDVGCGTGATTVAAAQVAERAVGVDISERHDAGQLARRGPHSGQVTPGERPIKAGPDDGERGWHDERMFACAPAEKKKAPQLGGASKQ
jgi:SAM-dependent methyltransferase